MVSLITLARILGALALLWMPPLSAGFFWVYGLCCVSDMLDGFIARRTNATSQFGAALDSVADFMFIAMMFWIFLPLFAWEMWMLVWMGLIALTRFASLIIGFVKYRAFAFLHTYANKITGIALAGFPIVYQFAGMRVTVALLCGVASLSALEELAITLRSGNLDRNIKGLFFR